MPINQGLLEYQAIYVLSVVAFLLQWQCRVVPTEISWDLKYLLPGPLQNFVGPILKKRNELDVLISLLKDFDKDLGYSSESIYRTL